MGRAAHTKNWRAWPSAMVRSTVAAIAAGGGGSVGDRRPRATGSPRTPTAATVLATATNRITGHPVAVATLVVTRLLGWPLGRCLAAAGVLDCSIPTLTARHPAASARFLRLWTLARRFRNRWPASLGTAERALDQQLSVGAASSEAVPASPPSHNSRTIPSLARLPHRIEGSTVAWAVDAGPLDDLDGLARDVERLSLVDPRVVHAHLGRRHIDPSDPDQSRPASTDDYVSTTDWEVVVDFDVEPPTWALSLSSNGAAFRSIDQRRPPGHHRTKGGTDGNG